jgi:tetratricopeptide (TPR) repeat protein
MTMKKGLLVIAMVLLALNSYSQTSGKYTSDGLFRILMGNYVEAIVDFNKAINMDNNPIAYMGRGEAKYKLGDYRGAIQDLNQAITRLNSSTKYIGDRSFFLSAYKYRGLSKYGLKNYKGAIDDLNKALEYIQESSDMEVYPIYSTRGLSKFALGFKNEACLDWSKSGELGNSGAYDLIRRYCN